ncbi:MAG TPA: PAS domain S-box protein [Thermoanaerobaculia bacterium]|nr:PAS domain S-box protein [Thermoanaerobaculia bacterium]
MDDAPASRLELRSILDSPDLELIDADSAEEALDLVARQPFAAVLVDLGLPGLGALETARRIRSGSQSRSTPILFLAGAGAGLDRETLQEGYSLGAVDFLEKPLMPLAVRSKVRGFAVLFAEAQRAVREAEQLRMLVQGTHDYAIFMLDPQGRVVSWNTGAERLKGYSAEDIIGRHFSTFYPQEVVDRGWPEHELRVASTEGRFEDEGWRIRKDGSRFWANVVITALRDAAGRLRGFSKVTRDLTARKQAEEAARQLAEEEAARRAAERTAELLAEERERLQVTLASIGDAVISTDRDGRVEFLNPIAEAAVGWKTEEAAGRPLDEVFRIVNEETRRPVENPALRALSEGVIVGLANHTLLIARDGTERPIDDSASPIRDSAGDVIGSVLVFRDITARRRVERLRNVRLAVTQVLAEAATAEEGAAGALAAVGANMGWDVGLLWTVDEEASALVCRSRWQRPGAAATELVGTSCSRTFGKGEGLPGRVWADGAPAWIVDVTADSDFPRAAAASDAGLRSAFGWPILVGERFLGVIEFFTERIEQPEPDLLELVSSVAGGTGQFLERRRAEEQLREQTLNAEALVRVGSLLAQQVDLQRLVQVATDEGTRLCGAQFGAFFYNVENEAGEAYTLYTLSGVPHEAFARFPMPRSTAVFGPTFRGESIVRSPDITRDPRYGKNAPYHGMPEGHLPVRSYLAVPVVSRGGEVLGGLFFGHAEAGVFTPRHERLLAGVAGQTAVAIDNARLYQRTQASAERLNLALSAADLGDWSWDAASDMVTFSERAAEIFGIPPGPQLTWTAMQDLLHPEDRERARQEVERVIAERVQYDIEYRLNRTDGMLVWVGALGRAVYGDSGEVAGMYGVVQDISERKQLEQSLRDSEARFRGLMEQAPFSVQVFAPDGRTVRVNRAWEDLWGVTLDQIEGYNILVDQQLEAHGVLPLIHRAFAGEPTSIPAVRYNPNEAIPDQTRHADPVRWVAAVAYPLKDAAGAVREVVLVHDDVTARRRAEAALRESEEKLRLLADTIPQLAWMAAPDGNVFWYNRRWYEYTGSTPEEVEGWGWQSVHDPAVLPAVLERWRHSLAIGEPFDMVFPLRGADGAFRPFLTRINPLRDDDGRILYWFGTNTDITELRQAREALATSEERLRLALDAGRMGVWDWNVRTGELQWSDSLEPLHGLAPGTFGGTFDHFLQLVHPQDRGAVEAAIQQALEDREEFYVEFRNVRPDGSVHWIAGSGKVYAGEDGTPLRMIGIGLDVTQRKRSEQTARFLADASAALAGLVDFDSTLQKLASLAVPHFADWAAVDLLDPTGTLRRVAVAHVDAAKVQLAHDLHRRFPPAPDAPTGVWHILRTGVPELVGEISDEMLAHAVQDQEALGILRRLGLRSYIGVPLVVRGTARGVLTFIAAESGHTYDEADLSVAQELAHRAAIAIENAELYEELRQADRRKDEFLATLAHELRNPLAPIRNGLQVMRLIGPETPALVDARAMMERQVTQLVRLVDDLLDVSRITRNRLELRKELVPLDDVVQNAIETSRPFVEQSGHTLSVTLPARPIYLDADPVRLAQVLSNLLNNSAKYSEPGGRIALTAEVEAANAVIRVRDDGIGIPADALPHIFEMFSQVDRGMSHAQGGLGIGLTLVRRLVEMHGGTVEAASEGTGRGSEFTVTLPIPAHSEGDESERNAGPTPPEGPARRILVVDDNRDAAETLGMMLSLMGHDVRTAFDGPEALDVAEELRPDIVLLDIGLPMMNGYEVCRRMRRQAWSSETMIVALTGWGQEEDRRRSHEAGFDHHVVKPVETSELVSLLARGRS